MTIEELLKQKMVENGLWPEETDKVIEELKSELPNMEGVWHRNADDYPASMFVVLWLNVQTIVIKWMDKHCPKHFARPMFCPETLFKN